MGLRQSTEKELIRKYGINPNCRYRYGNTALHHAVILNNKTGIRELLNHPNINVNIQNNAGNTALHYALTLNKKKNLARALIAHPNINVNIQNNAGNTALHYASVLSNELITELLKRPDVNINIRNNLGNTVLNNAVHINIYRIDVVNELLKRPELDYTNIDDTGKTAFQYVLKHESREHPVMINAFIEAGAYTLADVAYLRNKDLQIWNLYKNRFQSLYTTLDEGPLSGMPQVISSLVAETLYPGIPFW